MESWKQLVKVWDQTHQASPGNQKLMSILAALQQHHPAEHERLVFKTLSDDEFMKKVNDKENEVSKKIADKCLKELDMWYGKTKMERLNENWKSYKNMHQENGEKTMDFVRRFQNFHSKLEKEGTPIHPYLLALDLLKKSNLDEKDINTTIANCDMEKSGDEIYEGIISPVSYTHLTLPTKA